jgi:type IV pilus assembly protein PilY1
MNLTSKNLWSFGAGALWVVLSGAPALAEDVELFVGSAFSSNQARPNILFILDDSGSMASTVYTQTAYDPAGPAYPAMGNCRATRVYFSTNGVPPDCLNSNPNQYFDRTALHCRHALDAFAVADGGRYQDVMVSYDSGTQKRWEKFSTSEHSRPIECQDDTPDSSIGYAGHGSTAAATPNVYPRNGNTTSRWTNTLATNGGFAWGGSETGTTYWLFDGNYLNWYFSPGTPSTRLQVMKEVANNVLNSINGVNVGLMNFSNWTALPPASEGGPVRYAMENVATGRAGMQAAISGMTAVNIDFTTNPITLPSKWTPLSETLYESTLYWMGGNVRFGLGNPQSVAASRLAADQSQYLSPIGLSCQKNHVVLLTDGQPTYDTSANAAIVALRDAEDEPFTELVGATCDADAAEQDYPAGAEPTPSISEGACLDDLAAFMQKGDLSPLPGQQNVVTHTVGFHVDLPILEQTAARGGGKYYTATDTASLTNALTDIVTNIVQTQTTFTSPAVSVNSFNRTRNLNDLYISVFRPTATEHWPGNLKKYRLRVTDGLIVDANDEVAIDPATGFFAESSQSYWSADVDGPDVELGGAANEIPASRNVYTYLGDPDLTATSNRVATTNTLGITDALLNTGGAGLPARNEVINFINGLDAADVDNDGVLTEARNQMGDPLHAQPASVIYGPTVDDAVLYFATNDGFLHAIDPTDGSEKWAFVPEEFLGNQVDFFLDSSTVTKTYGIDGSLRVQMVRDNDGVIEPLDGERVYLFFGVRRGGDIYYGLDVTDPDEPQLLWRHDSSTLPGIGQTWSAPTPARINISGASYDVENPDQLVLVLGGGYDTDQDNSTPSTDSIGNSIYIIDSVNGNVLWRASSAGATQNFSTAAGRNGTMAYSIPADVKVVDMNTDGFADRMYAADMGGQVWRFDIQNGQTAGNLTTGGVIARLGSAASATPTVAQTRRFYYSPDVALVNTTELKFIHIGIGSGHRPHPNSTAHQDRFYALRDYFAFGTQPQAQFDALAPILDGDLDDITADLTPSIEHDSPGWRLELRDGGWTGEKVLAEARTFNNQVFFTTFKPGASASADPCVPSLGTNRLYVMNLFTGAPVMDLRRDGEVDETELTLEDRYVEFAGSIAADVVFLFPSPDNPDTCVGEECTPPPLACVDLFCLPTGFSNAPIRTFWSQESVD